MNDHPLAYDDTEFMESQEARPIRILAEYLDPLRRFKAHNIQDTVVFFGSARVLSRHLAQRNLSRLQKTTERGKSDYKAALKRSRKALEWSRYYEDARTLARQLTKWSMSLEAQRHRFVVCSGGGPGIMEAANRGAKEAGGKSVGLNIALPFEQAPNRYITKDLVFNFHYFFMRKFWFAYLAKAIVVFPGGFGTLDEMFEALTLVQTRKMTKPLPIVLFGTEYWKEVINFDALVKHGTINAADVDLMYRTDSVDDAYHWIVPLLTKYALDNPGAKL